VKSTSTSASLSGRTQQAPPPPPAQFSNEDGMNLEANSSGHQGECISSQSVSSKTRTVETLTVSN